MIGRMGEAPLCVLCRTPSGGRALAAVLQRALPQRGPGAMGGRTAIGVAGEPMPIRTETTRVEYARTGQ